MSSATRALRVFEYLLTGEAPSQAELARALGVPTSTLSDLLVELRQLGYVHLVGQRYRPGPALVQLNYRGVQQLNVLINLRPTLQRLAHETGESAIYCIEVGGASDGFGEILLVDQVESEQAIRYVAPLGIPVPFGATAAGRVLLAYSSRDVGAFTPQQLDALEAADAGELSAELAEVRRLGYAVMARSDYHVFSVVAPVFGAHGEIAGAISISGPAFRMSEPDKQVAPILRRCLRDAARSAPGAEQNSRRRRRHAQLSKPRGGA
jgi:DNA-binding IclR family transcriptional regulator